MSRRRRRRRRREKKEEETIRDEKIKNDPAAQINTHLIFVQVSERLSDLYQRYPHLVEQWLREDRQSTLVNRVAGDPDSLGNPKDIKARRRPQRNHSVTSDLFHVWLSQSPKKAKSPPG